MTPVDGSVYGHFVAATNNTVTFDDGVKMELRSLNGDSHFWEGKTLMDVGTIGTITDYDKIDAGFYNLIYDVSGSHILKVDSRNSFSDQLDVIADDLPVAPTPNMRSVFGLIDRIDASGENDPLIAALMDHIDDITNNVDPGLVELALRQMIGESVVNVASGVANTAIRTQGVVFNRLDRIREAEIDDLTPPAAGSGEELNRIWVGGFGTWADARNRDGVFGYEYSGGGVALGFDRKVAAVPGLRVGLSAAWAAGDLDNNDGLTKADLDTAGLGVYGSYMLRNGVFFDANVAYAHSRSDYTTDLVTGGTKEGSFDIDSWQFGVRGGAVIHAGTFQIIPSVGVRYITLSQGGWDETLSAAAAANGTPRNRFAKNTDHQVDIPLQVKLNTTFQTGTATVTPELRLGWTLAAKRPDNDLNVGFVGSSRTARIVGVRPGSSSFQAGAGLKVNTGGLLDVFLNYDLDAARGFHSHNGSVGLGFEF
ncbi:MAG: autotransporter outer membrane beta-barrel domain-containing protein [Deltaproteobacteria bacterium]|nr:autotransporter outer membrane beta-barrel domain-containing protein [Deltaproteobacteria bacterium]